MEVQPTPTGKAAYKGGECLE